MTIQSKRKKDNSGLMRLMQNKLDSTDKCSRSKTK